MLREDRPAVAPKRPVLRIRRRTSPGTAPGTLVVEQDARPPTFRLTAYGAEKLDEATTDRVEEAFDPFFGEAGGPAPGSEALRMAARVIADHGGALQLRPDAESGTRASFVLPGAKSDVPGQSP